MNQILQILIVCVITTTYHLLFRWCVGEGFNAVFHNKVNFNCLFFRVSGFERRFYKLIGVKKWKNRIPTYDSNAFNPKIKSWEEIASATCQSEMVHEMDAFFSLLSFLGGFIIGSWLPFIVTGTISFVIEMIPVFMQRYNRDRILKFIRQ